jgi:hypothetical protein
MLMPICPLSDCKRILPQLREKENIKFLKIRQYPWKFAPKWGMGVQFSGFSVQWAKERRASEL